MKPTAITLFRFRGWKDERRISLDAPITSIVADNGRGKSSLLNAIEWCLYGAIVTKKGSGIDERQDWEVRTRINGDDSQPTHVELELATAGGLIKVCRERSATAKAREADQLTVEEENGDILNGDAAETWLTEAGIPDWETYRRAYCFHQEAARQRVVAANERTAILAGLLGLEDDLALRATIESNQPSKLFAEIDQTLDSLNDEAHRALDIPRQRLNAIEQQASEAGLDLSQLSESHAKSLRSQLVTKAKELGDRLGLSVDLPDAADADAVRLWAPTWPANARSSSPVLDGLEDKRRQAAQLDTLIATYESEHSAYSEVAESLKRAIEADGDEAKLEAAVAAAKSRLSDATKALKQANAMATLLVDAKDAIEAAGNDDQCPVCETGVPGLTDRLESTINRLRSDEFEALQGVEQSAREELEQAEAALKALQTLTKNVGAAQARLETQRDRLLQALGADANSDIHDVLAEAKKRLEKLKGTVTQLEGLASARDEKIREHQQAWGQLELIEKWFRASENVEQAIDLPTLPEWSQFNDSLDELSAFGTDLAYMGALAREVQAERSHDRATEVNKALAKYYSMITQDEATIRVNVHTTAQRVSYELVDATDKPAVPILNQAAINALSLAMLFAQSEAQAGAGAWNLVTLDDPVQSLDADKQKGLATAIEELAENCSVLVGAVPGALSDRIDDYVSKPRHIVTLGPWSNTQGASVSSEVDR
jgi:DNA repair exonuclease SbcCD ATPase subunit